MWSRTTLTLVSSTRTGSVVQHDDRRHVSQGMIIIPMTIMITCHVCAGEVVTLVRSGLRGTLGADIHDDGKMLYTDEIRVPAGEGRQATARYSLCTIGVVSGPRVGISSLWMSTFAQALPCLLCQCVTSIELYAY